MTEIGLHCQLPFAVLVITSFSFCRLSKSLDTATNFPAWSQCTFSNAEISLFPSGEKRPASPDQSNLPLRLKTLIVSRSAPSSCSRAKYFCRSGAKETENPPGRIEPSFSFNKTPVSSSLRVLLDHMDTSLRAIAAVGPIKTIHRALHVWRFVFEFTGAPLPMHDEYMLPGSVGSVGSLKHARCFVRGVWLDNKLS